MEKRALKLRPCLSQLNAYVAGKGYTEISRKYNLPPGDIVKLGSNENPYGPTPKVARALQSIFPERYPEPEELLSALSGYIGFPEENIVVGAGMDGVMETLTRLFLEKGDKSFIPIPTFSYYEILTILSGATPVFVDRSLDFEIPQTVPNNVKMAFICSPNNPTGNASSEETVLQILETTEAIVFLDEAYVEFADKSLVNLVKDNDNLIVGRTMSKAFGLAGLRIGYAVAPDWIANQYRRAAPPFFGITCASVAAGITALNDLDYMHNSVLKIRSERERLLKEMRSYPSQANFLYVKTIEPSDITAEKFLKQGIIIRDCHSFRGAVSHHIRVTVGTSEQNNRFLEVYQKLCR
ncbi:MAG: histidinol-phosphate transaminase [Methanotrichaceae archaeon]|nr:histidinol-phosphate transaminase [Methanotrichaceae archaeon]